MNVISIITPVFGTSASHLGDAAASVTTQQLPEGWELEWLVQQDGPAGDCSTYLPEDPRISFHASARWGGQATARNLALARARGTLIKTLDADDRLTDGALARDIAVCEANPTVGWSVARTLNWTPEDGALSCWVGNPTPGPIERGSLLAPWEILQEPPIHPASLCARRDLLSTLGGWMAVPSSEDTGLLLALNAISDGYFLGAEGLYYRLHPDQSSKQPSNGEDRQATFTLIGARARALTATGPVPQQ